MATKPNHGLSALNGLGSASKDLYSVYIDLDSVVYRDLTKAETILKSVYRDFKSASQNLYLDSVHKKTLESIPKDLDRVYTDLNSVSKKLFRR